MPWFQRHDDEHIQEVVAVELRTAGGETIGWVAPEIAAGLAEGSISPEQAAEYARECPEQPAGTQAMPGGLMWEQDEPQGERRRWWE